MKPKRPVPVRSGTNEVQQIEDDTMEEIMNKMEQTLRNTMKDAESYRIRLALSENRVIELENSGKQEKENSSCLRHDLQIKSTECNGLVLQLESMIQDRDSHIANADSIEKTLRRQIVANTQQIDTLTSELAVLKDSTAQQQILKQKSSTDFSNLLQEFAQSKQQFIQRQTQLQEDLETERSWRVESQAKVEDFKRRLEKSSAIIESLKARQAESSSSSSSQVDPPPSSSPHTDQELILLRDRYQALASSHQVLLAQSRAKNDRLQLMDEMMKQQQEKIEEQTRDRMVAEFAAERRLKKLKQKQQTDLDADGDNAAAVVVLPVLSSRQQQQPKRRAGSNSKKKQPQPSLRTQSSSGQDDAHGHDDDNDNDDDTIPDWMK